MNQLSEFLDSGLLELYVMGLASPDEILEVERMAAEYPEIRREIEQLSEGMEAYAQAHAVKPRATIKTEIMAAIDYKERLEKGEPYAVPPMLTPQSRKEDFDAWLNRADMVAPAELEGMFAKVIGVTPEVTTAILWFQDMQDYEVHNHEYEHFLILEGSCDFTVGDMVHTLLPGDYIAIPLHVPHIARVTSDGPCKAILQRVAA